jgi:DGQHR domain-containing protein
MTERDEEELLRYSVSLVTQGRHRFYTLTVHSDVLARTCFVTTRYEDPKMGFQRLLDKERAQQIAEYIDNGLGTIPNSIILSAQPEAMLKVVGRGKALEFRDTQKSFLILDGQHRVYGFSLAKTSLRVPVVVYNGLSRKDESRLFIDINTKQRPVPNELPLDIKQLAEYETDTEQQLREIYDMFNTDSSSPLLGMLSPSERMPGKISRVTFNAAVKPLVNLFGGRETPEIFHALSGYLQAFITAAASINAKECITNPTVFRAIMLLFPDVAQRVQDRHGRLYTVENFDEVLEPAISGLRPTLLNKPGNASRALYSELQKALRSDFSLF